MRKIPSIVFGWIIGLIVFLVILFILNRIYIDIDLYNSVLGFINANALFLIFMSFFFMLSEVFRRLPMPFVLPGPLVTGVASVMVTVFIIRMLLFVQVILGLNVFSEISFIFPFIYAIVFLVVVISGYIRIFSRKERPIRKGKHVHHVEHDDHY